MFVHKLKPFLLDAFSFITKRLRRRAKRKKANDLCIPFCHATSSFYINPSVALMIEAITGQEFLKCFCTYLNLGSRKSPCDAFMLLFRAQNYLLLFDLQSESTLAREPCCRRCGNKSYFVEFPLKCWQCEVEPVSQFHRNRMWPFNVERQEIGFWRFLSAGRVSRKLTH